MQLRRIEVRDFRKIAHRVIDGLDDGLNVVVGDNEAGKSTLLAALRTVFFERHTVGGDSAKAMLPYGATVRPEIQVVFDIDGRTWRLRKAFLQRPEAELTGPGERILGTAVEERLADLLGFSPAGRGLSKPEENHGTHGLLWVEQGTRDNLGVGAGRDTLAAALEREVGQVTGGDRGRALLAAAARRRDLYWSKTDKPRGDYKAERDTLDRLEGEHAALLLRRQDHDAKISRLEEVAAALARHERDNRLAKAVEATAAARRLLAAAQALDGVLQQVVGRRLDAERELAATGERRVRRRDLAARVEAAGLATEAASREARESATLAQGRTTQVGALEARLTAARQAHAEAQSHMRATAEALAHRQAREAFERQRTQFEAAETQDRARGAALAAVQARPVDREALARLTKLERNADTARAELKAAGVKIRFEPDATGAIAIDGVPHPADAPLTLTRDAVLTLEGFGRMVVRPGGGTAGLARTVDEAAGALADALARVGVASTADAAVALDRRTAAEAEAASLGRSLAALAPKGIEALRQALATEAARLALPLSEAASSLLATADADGFDEAKRQEAVTASAVTAAEAERGNVTTLERAALQDETRLAERHAGAGRQALALQEELARAQAEQPDENLDRQCEAAAVRFDAATAAEQVASTASGAADLDTARLVLERTEAAERAIGADVTALDREKRDLQAELRGVGQDGIGERLADLDGQIALAGRRLARQDLEAAASRLLHEALQAAQSKAKDRWLGPVRERVSPYLRLLHPDSDIVMNEHTLEIEGFSRNGVTESFGALSMGAREQVAVITRLALADVLRAAGHPATVILDDALVNTDEARLDRMHNVLTRAARGLQILILTCRERDFIGLGKVHRV